MIPSFRSFQMKIKREFLKCSDKNGLFGTLRIQLRAFLDYPAEYIMNFLETISEPMPLHAAVSACYFSQHGCLPDKLPVFMSQLCNRCEQNFIMETKASDSDLQKCADLHTAFSYLNPEYSGTSLPEAVEKLSQTQRKTLFREIGRCVRAVHDITQEERDLLDPVLKYFSLHYPEEINGSFLEQNHEQFSELIPKETTLSELLVGTVKKQYFNYFRILYSLFPSWHMNQNEITCGEWVDLSFQYADSPPHLLDSLYIALQLAKEGHTHHKAHQVRTWYKKVLSHNTNFQIWQIVSYLRDAHCIESDPEHMAEYIHAMPFYEEDNLFLQVLPSHSLPIGGIFLQISAETILRHDSSLLREYLGKIEKNNIYRFDTELDCPDAELTDNFDYISLIRNISWNHTAEDILYFYFNTHIRKIISPWKLYQTVETTLLKSDFDKELQKYIFFGNVTRDSQNMKQVFHTTQFFSDKKLYILSKEHVFKHAREDLNHVHLYINSADLFTHPADRFTYLDKYRLGITEDPFTSLDEYHLDITFVVFSEDEQKLIEKLNIAQKTETLKLLNDIKCKPIEYFNDFEELCYKYNIYSLKSIASDEVIPLFLQRWKEFSANPEQNKKKLRWLRRLAVNLFLDSEINTDKFREETIQIFNIITDNLPLISIMEFFTSKMSPFRKVVDITDAINNSEKEENPEQLFFLLNMKGEIHKRQDGKIQFIPDDLISKKSPIFAMGLKNLKEHTKYTAKIVFYDKKEKCFLCSHLMEESFYEQVVPVIECLKKAITDNAAFDELENLDILYGTFRRLDFDINSCIITTISNSLKNRHSEQIIPYLKKTEKINPYHLHYYDVSLFSIRKPLIFDIHDKEISETMIELIKDLTQQCSPATIFYVYMSTELRSNIKLNILLKYADIAGKLQQLMEKLKYLSISIDYFDFREAMHKEIITPMIGDMTLWEFYEVSEKKGSEKYFQFDGYDPTRDIVILKPISKEEAETNAKKLAESM